MTDASCVGYGKKQSSMSWHAVAQRDELAPGRRKLCEVAGRRLAIFCHGDAIVAIDNHCPHRGGPVGAGPLAGNTLTCPWHGLKFDLASGQCEDFTTHCLVRLPTRVVDGAVEVDLSAAAQQAEPIFRYLVRYGLPAHVGRFGSIKKVNCVRGDRVLVLTDRGAEVGEVLIADEHFDPADKRPPAGELVRLLAATDINTATMQQQSDALRIRAAEHLALHAPTVILLDAELTHDQQTLILYHPAEATAALGPLAAQLAAALALPRVQFETLAADATRKVASGVPRPSTAAQETDMRGPYERIKYDFRRVWECPVCHHRERTAGTVTSQFCACQAKEEMLRQQPMKLIEDGPRRTDGKVLPPRKASVP